MLLLDNLFNPSQEKKINKYTIYILHNIKYNNCLIVTPNLSIYLSIGTYIIK